MSQGYDPSDVPLYESHEVRDEQYYAAEAEGRPFFAVERYEEGYAITYDLLPAGHELTPAATESVADLLTEEVEAVVADADRPTTEVSKGVSASLGSVSAFRREATAREVASALSRVVLDRSNWVEAAPDDVAGAAYRHND
jgi:hypothetical protein